MISSGQYILVLPLSQPHDHSEKTNFSERHLDLGSQTPSLGYSFDAVFQSLRVTK